MKVKYLVFSALLMFGVFADVLAQSTSMTYQGRLQNSGEAFNGNANFQFLLFNALVGGSQIGSMQNVPGLPVDDGLFQVELDFGPTAFGGGERYLEIWVNGAPLSPRQPIHAAPVALFALDGNDGPQGPPGPAGPQGPQGADGTSPFSVDPTDGSFEYVHENGLFRFTPNAPGNAYSGGSLVVGRSFNEATGRGAVALGGGRVFGGDDLPNTASASASAVIGGYGNSASHSSSTVIGGYENSASGPSSAVVGGNNGKSGFPDAVVVGGEDNMAWSYRAVTIGGKGNTAWGPSSVTMGDGPNCAGAHGSFAGGTRSIVRRFNGATPSEGACLGVPVGEGTYGDTGTFVWNADWDGTGDFVSSGPGQFLVMAPGGAVITHQPWINNPDGNRLRVNGTLRVDSLGSSGSTSLCRNFDDQIATCSSSARYKENIRDLELDSSVLMALRPVRYRWIGSQQEDIGLVAEEVAELVPELATYNEDGQVEGLKYDRLAAWLVAVVQQQESERQRISQEVTDLRGEMVQTRTLVELNETLREQNESLEARLAALESLLMGDRELAEIE